ncbi:MAG: hypothetical protein R3F61_36445 [Myxococcota bacterium]
MARERAARAFAVLVGVSVCIALADAAQVVWLGKRWGAIGGVLIYGAIAVFAHRGARPAAVVALLMPMIPLSVFVGLQGEAARERLVDTGMIAVFVLQVLAAVSGLLALRRPEAGDPG